MLWLALCTPASAYTTADGYSARDYATGFAADQFGPIGLAFDRSDNLYVGDPIDRHVYRFQPGGGITSRTTRLSLDPIPGLIAGLAFGRDGHLYAARKNTNDVVEIDQASGRVKRVVATGVRCATGLASDPASGDLFVSQNACRGTIVRISDFATGRGTTSVFAKTGCCADGLAFAPDGTLFAASAGSVLRIEGTASSTPGLTRSVTSVPGADGVAIGAPREGGAPFLVVNGTDGKVTRLDLATDPPGRQTIFSGGSRGDFVAVDSHGCLYITQRDRVVRIDTPGAGCNLAPSTPGAQAGAGPPGITIDTLPTPRSRMRKCLTRNVLVVRVRQRGRVRLRSVRVFVNGKPRRTLRHRRITAPIVIRPLPRGTFTVKLVARTTKGRKLTAKRRYRNCTLNSVAHR
jgi:sugar lactone lactonase YvrE